MLYTTLHFTGVYCTVKHNSTNHCTAMHRTVFHCTVVFFTTLHCTELGALSKPSALGVSCPLYSESAVYMSPWEEEGREISTQVFRYGIRMITIIALYTCLQEKEHKCSRTMATRYYLLSTVWYCHWCVISNMCDNIFK